MIDAIKSVGVLGLGVMGFDIAFLYAQKGYRTLVYDAAEAAMKNLTARRDQTIERLKRRNRISEIEVENVKHGLIAVPGLAAMASADLATEAVSESGKTKKLVYQALRDSGFGGILTTNTSSLIRSQSGRRRRLCQRAICYHALFQSGALHPDGRSGEGRHE